jgi:chromate transporter
MNAILLYPLLTKATITSFSGLASLPVLRQDLVVNSHVLTDAQLDTAVVVSRTTPGPIGVYVVSVGYYADGIAGAFAGWLAMMTPAVLIIVLLRLFGRSVDHPRVRSLQQAVVFASAGLLVAASLPLARDAVTGAVTAVIVIASLLLMVLRKVDALWIVVGAAVVNLAAAQLISATYDLHVARLPGSCDPSSSEGREQRSQMRTMQAQTLLALHVTPTSIPVLERSPFD